MELYLQGQLCLLALNSMVNRVHNPELDSDPLVQESGLQVPVQCVATDAKLSGQHRLRFASLCSMSQLCYFVITEGPRAAFINPSAFCQGDPFPLALANQCPFKLCKGSHHREHRIAYFCDLESSWNDSPESVVARKQVLQHQNFLPILRSREKEINAGILVYHSGILSWYPLRGHQWS